MIAETISFWVLAVVCVVAALLVVLQQNIFRSALALILSFIAVAGIYILLSAELLAVVQIIIYVGAISVIVILAIMMTREYQHGNPSNKLKISALVVSVLVLGVIIYAVLGTKWNVSDAAVAVPNTTVIANSLFSSNGYILPVEIAGLLLLAAVIGAIALVKDKK